MADHASPERKGLFPLTDGTYKVLESITKLGLPGAGAFYATIALIWGLPWSTEIVGTCAALAVFFGVLLAISKSAYNKQDNSDGTLVIDTSDPVRDNYSFDVKTPLVELPAKDTITLKVTEGPVDTSQ